MRTNSHLIDRLHDFVGKQVQYIGKDGQPFGPSVDKSLVISTIRSGGPLEEPAQVWLRVRSGVGYLVPLNRHHDHILVFNSNLMGLHTTGSALEAKRYYGAEEGVGEGLTGSAYALPIKNSLSVARSPYAVAESVRRFLVFAAEHPDLTFKVTRLGYSDMRNVATAEFVSLFRSVPNNCGFDPEWGRFGLKSWAEVGIITLEHLQSRRDKRREKGKRGSPLRGYRKDRVIRYTPPRGIKAPV